MSERINNFNAAKMRGAADKAFEQRYNYLIDILAQQLKVMQIAIANGFTANNGVYTLGLASSTGHGALAKDDWILFNGKQDHSIELDALSDLSDLPGLVRKTGDGTYAIDQTNYKARSVWGAL